MVKHSCVISCFIFCSIFSAYVQAETLQDAVKKGDYKRVVSLVSAGAKVNEKDKDGSTPLFWAAGIGNIDIAEYLISKGADVNADFVYGGTPIHSAVIGGGEKHIKIIALLIRNGADINRKNGFGTPLHSAVLAGNIIMIDFLIKNGADVNAKGGDGFTTPLRVATNLKNNKIITLLKNNGAKL